MLETKFYGEAEVNEVIMGKLFSMKFVLNIDSGNTHLRYGFKTSYPLFLYKVVLK